jgi:putative phosphoesterase
MNVGVISDTHGLLRPEVIHALRGSDHIIHAGDIGSAAVLVELAHLASLTTIRGNVDTQPWASTLPVTEVVELASKFFYVLHDINALDLNPGAAGFNVVISGHSHVPKIEWKEGVLYFNPGSAGPQRFKLPISMGRISINGTQVLPELITLG